MSDEKVAGDAVDAVTEEDRKQPENADIFLSFTQAFVESDHEKVSELLPSVEDFAPDLSTLCDRDGTSPVRLCLPKWVARYSHGTSRGPWV